MRISISAIFVSTEAAIIHTSVHHCSKWQHTEAYHSTSFRCRAIKKMPKSR